MTTFTITFIDKGNANNGQNPPSPPFPVLITPFLDIAFIDAEATGFINEAATGAIVPPGNSPS